MQKYYGSYQKRHTNIDIVDVTTVIEIDIGQATPVDINRCREYITAVIY